jgi:hypothetical protein
MSLSLPQAQYTGLSTDTKPILTDVVVGTMYYETDTFITYYWTGSKWKTYEQLYKEGRWYGMSGTSSADGCFQGLLFATGNFVRSFTAQYGMSCRVEQNNFALNSLAGFRVERHCTGALNPYCRIVFSMISLTNIEMFAGLTSFSGSLGRGVGGVFGDPYPENNSIGIYFRHGKTENRFELYHNGDASPPVSAGIKDDIVAADVDVLHTFEVRAINNGATWQYKIDHTPSWTTVTTTKTPVDTQDIGLNIWAANMDTTNTIFKDWRIAEAYNRIDNKG